MAIGWQYVEGTAQQSDVLETATFSSKNAGTGATGTIPDNGSGNITGPNDTLSGNGYYTSISNSITDRGALDINGPNDSGNAGYYDRIDNNIQDRGSIGGLSGGDYGNAGYYDSGTIKKSVSRNLVHEVNSQDMFYDNSETSTNETNQYDPPKTFHEIEFYFNGADNYSYGNQGQDLYAISSSVPGYQKVIDFSHILIETVGNTVLEKVGGTNYQLIWQRSTDPAANPATQIRFFRYE